jgi:hypothetical protein
MEQKETNSKNTMGSLNKEENHHQQQVQHHQPQQVQKQLAQENNLHEESLPEQQKNTFSSRISPASVLPIMASEPNVKHHHDAAPIGIVRATSSTRKQEEEGRGNHLEHLDKDNGKELHQQDSQQEQQLQGEHRDIEYNYAATDIGEQEEAPYRGPQQCSQHQKEQKNHTNNCNSIKKDSDACTTTSSMLLSYWDLPKKLKMKEKKSSSQRTIQDANGGGRPRASSISLSHSAVHDIEQKTNKRDSVQSKLATRIPKEDHNYHTD